MWAPARPGHQGSIFGLLSASCLTLALLLPEPQFLSLENRNKAFASLPLEIQRSLKGVPRRPPYASLLSGMNVNKNNIQSCRHSRVLRCGLQAPFLLLVGEGTFNGPRQGGERGKRPLQDLLICFEEFHQGRVKYQPNKYLTFPSLGKEALKNQNRLTLVCPSGLGKLTRSFPLLQSRCGGGVG